MRRARGRVVPIVAVVLVAASFGATGSTGSANTAGANTAGANTAGANEKQPAYAATLQRQIPQMMKANAIPGAVVLIRSPAMGDWSATFGTAEIGRRVPMSMHDYFRVGSNTKTMTSTVILQLVQEGRLKLDDPISTYLPGVPNGRHITIAELSEMRSGLFSYTFDVGFNTTLDSDPQRAWTPDQLLAIAFSHPPNFSPGARYEYSNTNIVLLGLVIQQLTGMSAAEAFEQRIFGPLALTHTSLPKNTDSSIPQPHAQGYQFGTNVQTISSYAVPPAKLPAALRGTLLPITMTKANPSWAFTAGGAISTPNDLAAYVKALVGGGLLDPKTQKLRLASIRPTVAGQPGSVGYGLGIARFAPNIYGHDGQIPGYSTLMVYDLNRDITIIIGTNLAASPVHGENAAVVLGKAVITSLHG